MFQRIAGIAIIFICTAIAWAILGTTIFSRTYELLPGTRQKVVLSWGGPHDQRPPVACRYTIEMETTETIVDGKREQKTKERRVSHAMPLERSRANVDLGLEHRQKGLLWHSTYTVVFAGHYTFRNTEPGEQEADLIFHFPSEQAIYDDLQVTVDGRPVQVKAEKKGVRTTVRLAPNAAVVFGVSYRSQGMETWRYSFGQEISQVRDFELRMKTNFEGIDFPEGTLSPGKKEKRGKGWELVWAYTNLMSGQNIGMTMPQKLQPGPLAGQISYFAPVSLLFFFFVMLIITSLRRIDLHPMNYFFLAAAFFAFHLLLAYLVDHISIHAAFLIASAVSIFLVVSYLRLVVGFRFAAVEAGSAQLVYLVLFSYAFFYKGFTGLAVTIGAVLTLFVTMQLTGRLKWGAKPQA